MRKKNFKKVVKIRDVHRLGWIAFWVDSHSTQKAWVNIKCTHNRSNVRVKPSGSGHQLSESEPLGNFGFEVKEKKLRNHNPKNTKIKTQKNTNMKKSVQKHKINTQKDTKKST